ncbi:MAG: hypothetical protein K6G23_08445, partial [Lachnospiraceae bacterium]|nr:hypothetical protein [Lachnospiraceae bacterium]
LVAIWIVSCLPLMTDQAVYQDDLFFHLTRIRGILDAWKDGQFPARLQPGWVNGMGYPLSIMYGDLLLWPTVVLYAATGQIVLAYRIGVALLNLLTVGIGYLSFYGMFQSRRAALCCSGLYVCAIYRLNNLYIRAAVGEATAMTFLPLIAWALSGLFHRDETEASDPKYLWILVLGMSGVLQSHVLSTEFAVALCILLFVIYWKRALRRKVLFHILEAIGLVALLNFWWLVPMLEYMSSLDLLVFHNWYSLQESGLYPAQLLSLFAFAGDSAFTGTNGMQNVRPFTIGIALMGALVLYGYQRLSGTNQMQCGKPEMQQHVRSIAQAAAIVAVVTLVLSLQIFPWDAIYEAGGIPAKIVASIQKPYRLLTIATVAAVVVAGALIREAGEHPKRATLLAGLFLSLGILQAAFVTEDLLFHKPQIAIENVEAIGTETLAGAEYIRNGVEYRSLSATQILFGEGVHGEVLAQDGTMRRLQLQNESTQLSYAEVSLLWYPGYQAMDTERGELLTVDASDTGRVRVWLPAGFEGEVIVAFHARPLWRAADLISLCTLLILLFVGIRAARNAAKDALQI